jgi:hypothetical protein
MERGERFFAEVEQARRNMRGLENAAPKRSLLGVFP